MSAISATLPGAAWQRCRTHYVANLMSATPKSSWGWVEALLHSVCDQPDAEAVHAQFDRVVDALAEKLPAVAEHLEEARADILAFTTFPKEIWRQIWSNARCQAAWSRSLSVSALSLSLGRLMPTVPAGVEVRGGRWKRSGCCA